MLQGVYSTQVVNVEGARRFNANPWDIRQQADENQKTGAINKTPIQMTSLSNDFIIDKSSIKLVMEPGSTELFSFQFSFTLKAPECVVTLH
jgi:hypothetical protein